MVKNTVVIIQVRMESTRLPEKVMKELSGKMKGGTYLHAHEDFEREHVTLYMYGGKPSTSICGKYSFHLTVDTEEDFSVCLRYTPISIMEFITSAILKSVNAWRLTPRYWS